MKKLLGCFTVLLFMMFLFTSCNENNVLTDDLTGDLVLHTQSYDVVSGGGYVITQNHTGIEKSNIGISSKQKSELKSGTYKRGGAPIGVDTISITVDNYEGVRTHNKEFDYVEYGETGGEDIKLLALQHGLNVVKGVSFQNKAQGETSANAIGYFDRWTGFLYHGPYLELNELEKADNYQSLIYKHFVGDTTINVAEAKTYDAVLNMTPINDMLAVQFVNNCINKYYPSYILKFNGDMIGQYVPCDSKKHSNYLTVFNNKELITTNNNQKLELVITITKRHNSCVVHKFSIPVPLIQGMKTHELKLELPANPFNADGTLNIIWNGNWERIEWDYTNSVVKW